MIRRRLRLARLSWGFVVACAGMLRTWRSPGDAQAAGLRLLDATRVLRAELRRWGT